jgi:hypothetical protein
MEVLDSQKPIETIELKQGDGFIGFCQKLIKIIFFQFGDIVFDIFYIKLIFYIFLLLFSFSCILYYGIRLCCYDTDILKETIKNKKKKE